MGLRVRTSSAGEILVKQWRFPCGEAGVKLEQFTRIMPGDEATITLDWEGNDDLFALGQLVDALRQESVDKITLVMLYFPYSRQDRRCHRGEGHALKIVADYINSLDFHCVVTYDAHSYVLEAVVNKLFVRSQAACAFDLPRHDILIAPDAGAAKKIYDHRDVQKGLSSVIVANKTRHAGGAVTTTLPVEAKLAVGKKVCVVDDLCDGGATFLSLAEILLHDCRLSGGEPKELNLYVTHGFFTKGVDSLLAFYSNIFVHNMMADIDTTINTRIKEI